MELHEHMGQPCENENADPLFKNHVEFQDGDSRAFNRAGPFLAEAPS